MVTEEFLSILQNSRKHCVREVLSRDACFQFLNSLLSVLFPHFEPHKQRSKDELKYALTVLPESLNDILECAQCNLDTASRGQVVKDFFDDLPALYEAVMKDAQAIYEGDPAAESVDEVILAYPGFYAIAVYRIANMLSQQKVAVLPRLLAEFAHERTGIDIHPAATIGESFCIDHGTGIVIGETTIIKDHVKVYQGVTLGALSVDKSFAATKRHPTIEENVVIYSGTTILGGETLVGARSVIGGNVWLTESVPADSIVYHQSNKKIKSAL